ncbi:erythromycin esterase family protein [Mariniflexile litorale]|uniref:Erythromycin esterase family protein n=1 Tax=Mariniflexile litorale TaxID=3045158 RepID=A0AAU7ED59_9FLAO|nr:erythromycin esterase family protein [Mariniflexile sp. KMM 9835]MDQ8212972.1 erythromycin esterase family protein [Mariniflexile sp. KMM 9835]
MKIFIILLTLQLNTIFAQVDKNIYELDSIGNLLTSEVKEIIDKNLYNKKVVFLGESEHHIGSEFLIKTEFIKYLVLDKGYRDIAFESDFFALFYEHSKENILGIWSNSVQCQELFNFLIEKNVTIWGFDNQMFSPYAYYNFSKKLEAFLSETNIEYNDELIQLSDIVVKSRFDLPKKISEIKLNYLIEHIDKILKDIKTQSNPIWYQILKSFRSSIDMFTSANDTQGIAIRDSQMAQNLDFLVKAMPNKKFIVWLANAHMAKYEYDFMKGQTMGGQFVNMNPEISYHIAISTIYMPYRRNKWIKKISKDNENLLHFLPSTKNNYFIDSKQLITENPDFADREYEGMFRLKKDKTNWFKHFDALVFISQGEKVKFLE